MRYICGKFCNRSYHRLERRRTRAEGRLMTRHRPFADAVRAGVGSVMCSYNKINGSWSCENEWTTNYLLKNELNFQGFGSLTPLFQ